MKTSNFLALTLCCWVSLNSSSQTLTSTNSNPVIGEVYRLAGGPPVAPGPAGSAQLWDFSSLSHTSTPNSYTWVLPSSLPGSVAYPSATIARQRFGMSNEYFLGNASGFENIGSYATGSSVPPMTFSNSEKLLCFPLSLGGTCSDSWANSQGVSGSTNFTADATGTLIVGLATYTNTIRVKSLQISSKGGSPPLSTTNEACSWYVPGIHGAVLSILSETFTQSSSTLYTSYSVLYSDPNNPLGITFQSTPESNFKFGPNPASDKLHFGSLNKIDCGDIVITLTDCQGNTVIKTDRISPVKGIIDISSLNPGIYIAEVSGKNFNEVKKIVIQR